MERVLQCDCGFEARAEDEGELIARVQRHAVEAHGMTLSQEQAVLLAFRAELNQPLWPRPLAGEATDEAPTTDI